MPELPIADEKGFFREIAFSFWESLKESAARNEKLRDELDEVKADRDFIRKACEDRDKLATELAALKAEKPTPRTDDEPAGKLYAAWCSFWSVWKNYNSDISAETRLSLQNWIGEEVENLRKAIEVAPSKPVTDAVRVAYYRLKEEWKITSTLLIDGDADRAELVSGIHEKLGQLGDAMRDAKMQPTPVTNAVREAWVPLDQLIRGSRFEDHGSLLTSCGAFIRFKAAIKSLLGPAKEST